MSRTFVFITLAMMSWSFTLQAQSTFSEYEEFNERENWDPNLVIDLCNRSFDRNTHVACRNGLLRNTEIRSRADVRQFFSVYHAEIDYCLSYRVHRANYSGESACFDKNFLEGIRNNRHLPISCLNKSNGQVLCNEEQQALSTSDNRRIRFYLTRCLESELGDRCNSELINAMALNNAFGRCDNGFEWEESCFELPFLRLYALDSESYERTSYRRCRYITSSLFDNNPSGFSNFCLGEETRSLILNHKFAFGKCLIERLATGERQRQDYIFTALNACDEEAELVEIEQRFPVNENVFNRCRSREGALCYGTGHLAILEQHAELYHIYLDYFRRRVRNSRVFTPYNANSSGYRASIEPSGAFVNEWNNRRESAWVDFIHETCERVPVLGFTSSDPRCENPWSNSSLRSDFPEYFRTWLDNLDR